MLDGIEPNIKAAIAWGADMATNTDGVTKQNWSQNVEIH